VASESGRAQTEL